MLEQRGWVGSLSNQNILDTGAQLCESPSMSGQLHGVLRNARGFCRHLGSRAAPRPGWCWQGPPEWWDSTNPVGLGDFWPPGEGRQRLHPAE